MAVFCTDAGHGGPDPGAVWHNHLEKDLNLRYTMPLNDELKQRGHVVWTTRKTDRNVPDLITRTKLVNAHHQQSAPRFDAIISIHCNVAAYRSNVTGKYIANEKSRGFYAIYSRESIKGRDLAQSMANEVINNGITVKHGGKFSTVELGRSLAWIHRTIPTAVLLELGYMTNPEELGQLMDAAYQRKMIRTIVNGLENFLP